MKFVKRIELALSRLRGRDGVGETGLPVDSYE
jgi:hypothetical protein